MTDIKSTMTTNVQLVKPTTAIQEAARHMREFDIGVLPVVDGDKVVGIVTDRDIAIRAVAEGLDPLKTSVKEAMTSEVAFCFENQTVDEVSKIMKEKQVRRVVVLDKDNKLAGICSIGDLTAAAGQQAGGNVLREVTRSPQGGQ